jgi:hypothetical protein
VDLPAAPTLHQRLQSAWGPRMTSIRRHLSYANVVATFALVFAMSGGALAAQHYLLRSPKQIKPSLLKTPTLDVT